MQPVPAYDIVKAGDQLTTKELNWLVFAIYFTCLCFALQMVMAIHHIWVFLIKQDKYKTTPLLLFYILVVLLSLSRIFFDGWILWEEQK